MTDKKQPKGGVRRVGKDNQKREIKRRDGLTFSDSGDDDNNTDASQATRPGILPEQADDEQPTTPGDPVDDRAYMPPDAPQAPKSPPKMPPGEKREPRFPPVYAEEMEPHIPVPPAAARPPVPKIPPKPPKRRGGAVGNVLTGLFALLTLLAVLYGVYIFMNPFSPLNPLAPPTPLPVVVSWTPLPPTETPVPSDAPTTTFTPAPTSTTAAVVIGPTPDPANVTPTLPGGAVIIDGDLITPTATINAQTASLTPVIVQPVTLAPTLEPTDSPFPFAVVGEREDRVNYMPNGNGQDCAFSSIAGMVYGLEGQPLNGLRVSIQEDASDEAPEVVFTGSSGTFGDGGWEWVIGGEPAQNAYRVQLLSQADAPLSESVLVITSSRCDQNVALLVFEQREAY